MLVEKLEVAVLLSFAGGILILLSGLFSVFFGNALSIIIMFGRNFLLSVAFMLFAGLAIVGIGFLLNNNSKNARVLGLAALILGAILLLLNFRSVFSLNIPTMFVGSLTVVINGFIAVSGEVMSMIGGAFALSSNPQRQPSILNE